MNSGYYVVYWSFSDLILPLLVKLLLDWFLFIFQWVLLGCNLHKIKCTHLKSIAWWIWSSIYIQQTLKQCEYRTFHLKMFLCAYFKPFIPPFHFQAIYCQVWLFLNHHVIIHNECIQITSDLFSTSTFWRFIVLYCKIILSNV